MFDINKINFILYQFFTLNLLEMFSVACLRHTFIDYWNINIDFLQTLPHVIIYFKHS